ncbi:MAG: threonine synthase [Gammaproteobacteria bacterium]
MSFVSHLIGIGSGARYSADAVMNLCPKDGRPVQIVIDIERLKQDGRIWFTPGRHNMWRFGALLALDIDETTDRESIVTLGEGHTPKLDLSADSIAQRFQLNLEVKDEGDAHPGYGRNPTGSFKDRGMAMVVSMAKRSGLSRLVVPTQGNAGDSLAEYAIAADLEAAVIMPDDTPAPILERVRQLATEYENIRLELVKGTIHEAAALMKERYVPDGWFNVATFQEPGWRIEGKKTLGLEIAESEHGWRLPDAIVYPTGGGTGILGMWKAFEELEALALIGSERPRMIAVQSAATAPLVEAWNRNARDTQATKPGRTIATGLNVPGGVGHFRVLEILRDSDGGALSVNDDAIQTTMRRILDEHGLQLGPEGAATLAALPQAFQQGWINAGDSVVAVNTGSYRKYFFQ